MNCIKSSPVSGVTPLVKALIGSPRQCLGRSLPSYGSQSFIGPESWRCRSRQPMLWSSGNGQAATPPEGTGPRANLKSTPEFFARLFIYSLLASLGIKYGSLLIDTPFEPNAVVALTLILGPTAVFSAAIAAASSKNSESQKL